MFPDLATGYANLSCFRGFAGCVARCAGIVVTAFLSGGTAATPVANAGTGLADAKGSRAGGTRRYTLALGASTGA